MALPSAAATKYDGVDGGGNGSTPYCLEKVR